MIGRRPNPRGLSSKGAPCFFRECSSLQSSNRCAYRRDQTVPYGTALLRSCSPRHFVPGYDRTVLPGHSAYLRPYFRASQIDHDVALRLGATDQQVALGGRFERFGLVVDTAGDQAAFAHVADARAAGPAHRHITGFREIEKAGKLCLPAHRETAAHKRNAWARTNRPL